MKRKEPDALKTGNCLQADLENLQQVGSAFKDLADTVHFKGSHAMFQPDILKFFYGRLCFEPSKILRIPSILRVRMPCSSAIF